MGRVIVGLVTLLVLGRCSAGLGRTSPDWAAVVTRARGVTITPLGHGAWQIRYQAPGAAADWYSERSRRLEARGWRSADALAYAPLNRSYSRATSLGVAVVWEWAFFSLDPLHPETAHIRIQRAIDVPWWRHLRRLVGGTHRAVVPLLPERRQLSSEVRLCRLAAKAGLDGDTQIGDAMPTNGAKQSALH